MAGFAVRVICFISFVVIEVIERLILLTSFAGLHRPLLLRIKWNTVMTATNHPDIIPTFIYKGSGFL
jgi:hypothetical protein